jgi:hypothetical protein
VSDRHANLKETTMDEATMSQTLKSYRDFFHVERDDLNIAATTEGGECEECGRRG